MQIRVPVIAVRRLVQCFCFCLCFGTTCVSGFAQTQTKSIIQLLTVQKYPVQVSFELNGEPLKFKETVDTQQGFRSDEFDAGADWLNQLTIKLTNVSDKTITYVNVNLRFPDVTKNGRTALHQIFIGVDPDRKFWRPVVKLAPKETLAVHVSTEANGIRTLLSTVAGASFESVSKVWVEFHAALLDDDMLFQAGQYYRRNQDTTVPGKWILIEKP